MTLDELTVKTVKCYVVCASDYDYYEIKGLYLSRERAVEHVAKMPEGYAKLCLDIEEHDLNIETA